MSTPITIPVNFDFGPGFSSVPRAANELQRLFNRTGALSNFAQPLGRISRSADDFANSLKAANARLLAFGASAVVLVSVQRALEGIITSTINVEKRLTDINVVLNESRSGLAKFSSELFAIARQTGQSFNDVGDAALELSRQGLTVQETLKRTRDALVLTRLSGLDAKDSVDALTAGINSFNKTLVSSTELVNKFAAVDARFAVSSADLAEALKRVGSTAQDAGVSLEELLGLVTAVQQTTARGGAVIGNAFKNIFSRLSRSTTIEDLKSLGVQIDASQTGVQKLQALADAYGKVGIAQANQIKEAAGGVYQINVVSAALDQLNRKYGTYQQALAAANSATDDATDRNEQLNKTLDALINRTQVNFTQLFSNIGKLTIDTPLRNILGGINSALESAADKEDGGGKLAESFLKGIGRFIEGPGLAYLGVIGLSLSRRLASFAGDSFKQLNGIRFGDAERRLNAEKAIQSILERNPQIQQQILNGSIRIEDIQSRILADLRDEVVLRERVAALSNRIAPSIGRSGIEFNRNTAAAQRIRAGGLIPSAEETMAESMGAYAAGYAPGVIKAANIPGMGRIVYNSNEKVVDIGLPQPAIIPPKNSKVSGVYQTKFKQKFGVDPYTLAGGHIPNFKNPLFSFFTDPFGDENFETPFGSGIVVINGEQARIDGIKVNPNFQGSGKTAALYEGLAEELKDRKVKSIIGELRLQTSNTPRGDSAVDKLKALLPQLTRGRYGKRNVLSVGDQTFKIKGGANFDSDLQNKAAQIFNVIQKSGRNPYYETFLNKGLVPNFLPTGILSAYREVYKKLKNKEYNTYDINPKSDNAMVRSAAGFFRSSDMSLNFSKQYENDGFLRAHEGTHNILALLNDNLDYSRPVKNLPGKFPLRIALALSGEPLVSRLKENAQKGLPLPSTLKRLIANPDLYSNVGVSFLEESLADNALNNQNERSVYTRNLGLTSRQADTISKLFKRLRKTGTEPSDAASGDFFWKAAGSIPNFLPTGILREFRRVQKTLARNRVLYYTSDQVENEFGRKFGAAVAKSYRSTGGYYGSEDDPINNRIHINKDFYKEYLYNRSEERDIDHSSVATHEGVHNLVDLLDRSGGINGDSLIKKLGIKKYLTAMSHVVRDGIERGDEAPNYSYDVLKSRPDLYDLSRNLYEESLANGDFRSITARKTLGLTDRASSTLSKLYNRLFSAAYSGKSRQEKITTPALSSGLVPNFNALQAAINRESTAVSPSQIRVGRDTRLVSAKNPAGLGVYNTKDEPGGLGQGIARAYAEGLNPKNYNVPNYATKKVISGGVDPLIVSGVSGGQKFEIIVKIPSLEASAANLKDALKEQRIEEGIKERRDAKSIARQAEIQKEEVFLYNTPFRRERRRLRGEQLLQERFQGPPLPPIIVNNPIGNISVPSLPGSPLATQPQTLRDRININNAVRQAQDNLNRLNEDATARDRRRLDAAANSINRPNIGRIVVPLPNTLDNRYVSGATGDRSLGILEGRSPNRNAFPPIIGSNGRLFIPGISDLEERRQIEAANVERQNIIRAQEERSLRKRATSIFSARSNRAQEELLSRGFINQNDRLGLQNLRLEKLQNLSLGVSFAAPVLSQIAADRVQNGKQSGRIGSAAVAGLGDAISFGATAFTATGGNPIAAGIGVVIGALNGLVNVAKQAGNTIPELTDKIEKLQTQSNDTARAANEYFTISEKIQQINSGQTSATRGQLVNLQSQQVSSFASLPQELRKSIEEALDSGNLKGAFEAVERNQAISNQSVNLLKKIVELQSNNEKLGANFNANRGNNGFLGLSGRNLSELTKFSIDNPLLGGTNLGGRNGTDIRKALRLYENAGVTGTAASIFTGLAGVNADSGALSSSANTLTFSESKELLRNRRLFNKENSRVANELGSLQNLNQDKNFAELAAKDPELQAALKSGSTDSLIKEIKRLAKANDFNTKEISEFLAEYTDAVPEKQYELFVNAAKNVFGSDPYIKNQELSKRINTQVTKDKNKNFDIDRSFNSLQDRLANVGTQNTIAFDNNFSDIQLANRIRRSRAASAFDIQNITGGERVQLVNDAALGRIDAGSQREEASLAARQAFVTTSFDAIRAALGDSLQKISLNTSASGNTPEQRQSKLNAVRGIFRSNLGLDENLNISDLNPDTIKVLLKDIQSLQNGLLTARENGGTLSIGSDVLNTQDINDLISNFDKFQEKLRDAGANLSTSLNKAARTSEDSIKAIDEEVNARLRVKNATDSLILSLEKSSLSFNRVSAVREAQFETNNLRAANRNTINNLGLVGFEQINAETSFNASQIRSRSQFAARKTERDLIGQALSQRDALGFDLQNNGISSLSDIESRRSTITNQISQGLDLEKNTELLNKYASLQQQIVEKQKELNELLPEQLAQEQEIAKLKAEELRFNTAFSDEKARLNLSGVEGRIRKGQGITAGDFRQTVGDQFTYTGKDFQRDAITGTAEVANTIKSSFASATADVIKNGKNIKEALTGVLTGVLDKLIDKTSEISTNFLFNGLKAVAGFSEGGQVSGGSGVRDDVPALLTKGEFVIKKDAVQKIGLQNLQKLNSGVSINLRNEYSYDNETRPTRGFQNIDPNLSVIGLTETEISRTNQLKFAREQELSNYLNEYRNYEKSKRDALAAYKNQKRNRLYGSYISAGIGLVGAGASSYFGSASSGTKGGFDFNYNGSPYAGRTAMAASGGVMFGGTSSSDTVPAMLTGGEVVMKKPVVDKLGVNFFNAVNNGYADGGLVRQPVVLPQKTNYQPQASTAQTNNISSQNTNNITISVNIASDGSAEVNTQDSSKKKAENGKALGDLISQKVKETLVQESKQGGLIYNVVRSR